MFAYELHRIRSAELIREAADHRLVREARRLRRASREAGPEPEREGRTRSRDRRRSHTARTA